jgi:hypothetical protein
MYKICGFLETSERPSLKKLMAEWYLEQNKYFKKIGKS